MLPLVTPREMPEFRQPLGLAEYRLAKDIGEDRSLRAARRSLSRLWRQRVLCPNGCRF